MHLSFSTACYRISCHFIRRSPDAPSLKCSDAEVWHPCAPPLKAARRFDGTDLAQARCGSSTAFVYRGESRSAENGLRSKPFFAILYSFEFHCWRLRATHERMHTFRSVFDIILLERIKRCQQSPKVRKTEFWRAWARNPSGSIGRSTNLRRRL